MLKTPSKRFYRTLKYSKMILRALNPLMTGGDKETTHTQTNLQLKAASLFKYVSRYCNHQALKG